MRDIYPLTLLYDAGCPVCALEMDHLRSRNQAGRLVFVDISAPGFDPSPFGATLAQMNAAIHAVAADGQVLRGVQVLRLAYGAVGLGWVMGPTSWPLLRTASEQGYRWFARHRHGISRVAAPLIAALGAWRARRVARDMQRCAGGHCTIETASRSEAGRRTR